MDWDEAVQQGNTADDGDVRLENLKRMALELAAYDMQVEEAEEALKKLKTDREQLRRFRIPALMHELGLESIGAGNKVCELTTTIDAKLPKDATKKAAALDWLVNNGHGGVIKRLLTVDLPKGDAVAEALLLDIIHENAPELDPGVDYGVHHSTYSALIRNLFTSGRAIPTELLGVTVESLAKVTDK